MTLWPARWILDRAVRFSAKFWNAFKKFNKDQQECAKEMALISLSEKQKGHYFERV